jgi:septal ring factor EnvC (AmiA/AmiB activator)
VGPFLPGNKLLALGAAAALCAGLVVVLLAVPRAGAADAGELEAKLAGARDDAAAIAADLRQSNAELATVQGEADAAAAREEKVSRLLAEGQERTAELSRELEETRAELAAARERLRRAREALSARLVAIYENGVPSTESLIFEAESYDSLVTQASYLRAIAQADSALAQRVADVRDEVRREAKRVAVLKARAIAHEERLAAAREEIASLRQAAEESAARLREVSARRQASLAGLKDDISSWAKEIQEVR